GGYPSAAAHTAILSGLADAGPITDTTRLLSGGPDAALFDAGAKFALASLDQLDEGEARLADPALTVTGRAKSIEAYAGLQDLGRNVPAGIELASLTITPPLASPYTWTATYTGTTLALTGNI